MATVVLSGIITPSNVVTATSTTTLTNKTISGASNTLTNIPLSTGVTGTLPIANGGTGTTSTTFVNAATNVTGTLPVANGGTGATSLSGITVGTATSATTATNIAGGSNGTIPYQSASGTTQMLAVGTAGQLLQTNGAGAPTWAAAPAGGSWIYLSTVTASGAATMDIETTFDSTYDVYKIIVSNLTQSLSSGLIAVKLKMGGTYVSSNYSYYLSELTGPTFMGASAVGAFAYLFGYSTAIGNGAGGNATAELTLYKPSSTTLYKTMQFIGTYFGTGGGAPYPISTFGNITYAGNYTTALTGVRLYEYSGGLLTGTARLYGLKNS